jgi:hypothetical protein
MQTENAPFVAYEPTPKLSFFKKIKMLVRCQASSLGWARPVYSSNRRVNHFLVEKK